MHLFFILILIGIFRSNLRRLNYIRFCTIILEKGDEIVAAASIRLSALDFCTRHYIRVLISTLFTSPRWDSLRSFIFDFLLFGKYNSFDWFLMPWFFLVSQSEKVTCFCIIQDPPPLSSQMVISDIIRHQSKYFYNFLPLIFQCCEYFIQ